jgi:hypothetical protein
MIRNLMFATVAVAVLSIAAAPVSAQFGEGNSPNNLFSQYYTQPGASQVQAGMYPAPHYVPENVGHTYYTYQPLMPHEMMYQHSRNYYNYYNTGGYYGGYDALNKTQVRWQSGTNHMGELPFSGAVFQSLQWKFNKRRYCLDGCGTGYGCATGDCGGSYEGSSYDAGCEGSSIGGGCGSGNCAANSSNKVQR